jgi:hypothetical protein
VPEPEAKPAAASAANNRSEAALRTLGGQTGRTATVATAAHRAATSAAIPMSPDGSSRVSSEKAISGRNDRMSGRGFILRI